MSFWLNGPNSIKYLYKNQLSVEAYLLSMHLNFSFKSRTDIDIVKVVDQKKKNT